MGAVNIFLGGTGKAVAEDIQDSRQFYDLDRHISEPVSFDLDARVRDGVGLNLIVADEAATSGVRDLATAWTTRDPGSGVAPAADGATPGPQRTPEQSLLVSVGRSISANPDPAAGLYALRAHGLAVFSMLFDEAKMVAGAGTGNALRERISATVRAATIDGEAPRINLVTSTAGGTGAGTVIPLALWLREQYPQCDLNLVAITASAFANVLKGNPTNVDRAAKGRSGTFAMFARTVLPLREHRRSSDVLASQAAVNGEWVGVPPRVAPLPPGVLVRRARRHQPRGRLRGKQECCCAC